MPDSENTNTDKSASARWDKIRASFQSSMLVDTKLSSLAESLDTEPWPLKGKDETPAKYVDLSYEELEATPEMQSNPERIALLVNILEGTLAFDDPFGEMVQAEEAASATEENEVMKNLRRLDIPPEFPLVLTNLSKEARQLCDNQNLKTLREFADFSQNMARHIVLAGDFRRLLNSLIHIDEKTIATYLPFRPGSKGLHLPEAIGVLVDSLGTEERLALYRKYGGRLEDEEKELADKVSRQKLTEREKELVERLGPVFEHFPREKADLESMINYGQALDRFFVPINNPVKETLAARLATTRIKGATRPSGPAPGAPSAGDAAERSAAKQSEGGVLKTLGDFLKKFRKN